MGKERETVGLGLQSMSESWNWKRYFAIGSNMVFPGRWKLIKVKEETKNNKEIVNK